MSCVWQNWFEFRTFVPCDTWHAYGASLTFLICIEAIRTCYCLLVFFCCWIVLQEYFVLEFSTLGVSNRWLSGLHCNWYHIFFWFYSGNYISWKQLLTYKETNILLTYTQTLILLTYRHTHKLLTYTQTLILLTYTHTTHIHTYYSRTHKQSYYSQTHILLTYTQTHILLAYTQTHILLANTQTHILLTYTQTHILLANTQTHILHTNTQTTHKHTYYSHTHKHTYYPHTHKHTYYSHTQKHTYSSHKYKHTYSSNLYSKVILFSQVVSIEPSCAENWQACDAVCLMPPPTLGVFKKQKSWILIGWSGFSHYIGCQEWPQKISGL